MSDINIYDSQGSPVQEETRRSNERIRDFFFDGVRLAVDTTGRTVEIVCFFRARETETARSEQYYAVYESNNIRDAFGFGKDLKSRIENDLGLLLDTSPEDTDIFDLILQDHSPSAALSESKVDDIVDLLDRGENAVIGASSYRDAYGVLQKFFREQPTGQYAIADNANSSRLSQYDLVIEEGSYTGIEVSNETNEKIEDMKRRRRQMQQGGVDQGSSRTKTDVLVLGAALIAVLGGTTLIATILLCTVGGVAVPYLDGVVPGCDTVTIEVENANWNQTSEVLTVEGTLKKGDAGLNGPVNLTADIHSNETEKKFFILSQPKTEEEFTKSVSVDERGSFTLEYNMTNATRNESSKVTLTFKRTLPFRDIHDRQSIGPPSVESADQSPDSTPTPTPTATPTPTPTATPTPTPTSESQLIVNRRQPSNGSFELNKTDDFPKFELNVSRPDSELQSVKFNRTDTEQIESNTTAPVNSTSWTPESMWEVGDYTVRATVEDKNNETDSVTWNITIVSNN